ELLKCPGRPTAQSTIFDEGIQLFGEYSCPGCSEFHDAHILAIGLVRIHFLGNFYHLAAAYLDLHFFVAIRIFLATTNQKRFLISCGEKSQQKLRMEKYICIHHHKTIQKKMSRQP